MVLKIYKDWLRVFFMGVIRGGLLIIVSIVLFFSLLAVNSFLTLSSSLEYENVQEEVSPLMYQFTNGSSSIVDELEIEGFNLSEVTDEVFEIMEDYCKEHDDYVFSFEGHVISIPCSHLESGKEAVFEEAISDLIEGMYYKDYDCDFWNCLSKEKSPFFLISQKAKDYWYGKFYSCLIFSLILLILIFLLVEQKMNFPIVFGGILIAASLPLLKIQEFIAFIIPQKASIISLFLGILFSNAMNVFWISFIIGLVLVLFGIILRIWKADLVKKKFSKEDVLRIINEEKKKEQKTKNKVKTKSKKIR